MSTIYKVYNQSLRDLLLVTTDFQKALDCWSTGFSEPYHHLWTIYAKNVDGQKYLQGKKQIQAYAEELIKKEAPMKFKNRINERIYNELQEQEADGMAIVEPQESYRDFMKRSNKEADSVNLIDEEDHSYDDYIRTVYRKAAADKANVKPDFHGEFSDMEDSLQDAIINPKHYKLFSKEDYSAYPNGIEYMDLCDKALAHLSGVEAHLVGQILKYTLRVGKKDAMEQDAKKIEWYATRLVNTVKGKY
jgi:hypothetical protein